MMNTLILLIFCLPILIDLVFYLGRILIVLWYFNDNTNLKLQDL